MSAKHLSSDRVDLKEAASGGVVSVEVYQVGRHRDQSCDQTTALTATPVVDFVAREVPVALVFNGVSHAVMLASPTDLADFARGFAITEGIVDSLAQIYDVQVCEVDAAELANATAGKDNVSVCAYEVLLEISSAAFARLKERRRSLAGRTGCGLCGTESLSQVVRPLPVVLADRAMAVNTTVIDKAVRSLASSQKLQALTGATHAAAWFDAQGHLQLIREDVGRHNALDKLVGAGLATKRADFGGFHPGFVLVTSRASMEMVQKTLAAGFVMLVAVSAPTSMAIDIAKQHGLTLVGFARPERCSIYHAPAGEITMLKRRDI